MVVLRSREVLPSTKPLTKCSTPEPLTPLQIREPSSCRSPPALSPNLEIHPPDSSTRRRSLRLASIYAPTDQNESQKRKMSCLAEVETIKEEQNAAFQVNAESTNNENVKSDTVLSLRYGKRVVKRKMEYSSNGGGDELVIEANTERDLNVDADSSDIQTEAKGKERLGEEIGVFVNEKLEEKQSVNSDSSNSRAIEKLEESGTAKESGNLMGGRRRHSREEKGKEKLLDNDISAPKSNANNNNNNELELELESKVKDFVDALADKVTTVSSENGRHINTRMEQFHNIARRNASRFAHFEHQEELEEVRHSPSEVDPQVPTEVENGIFEDWPGPFSTAMKIIRDRAHKLNSQQRTSSVLDEAQSVPVTWVPRRDRERLNQSRVCVPSLQELCMGIIVKNVDAVTSLDHVPDALRHRLCQLLCDCRRMNSSFLEHLVRGSPTEIRIKDCSWMTEEEFVKCFEGCDTNNLTVLQLDQCGRCMPDYVLPATLARSSRSMPALITLSLSGACRLSDIGLSSLVSAASALRSMNLSQCSLLSSASINILADSLGSVLRELYLDDCQGLDAMLILPALKKFEHLEVLSLARIQTVCDDFVRELVVACGHNIKELGLAGCTTLTDSSMKVIAETCPGLCALDLVNLRKLTDSALGYLSNGCTKIQKLKLCHNAFSDEGIAAFVETAGQLLKELSLNNVKKVGHNTAISLARRSRNLISLDLSWCRNLSDEALGLIVDSCSSLRILKLFGCGQITNVFLAGHSNPEVAIIGLKMSPVLVNLWAPESQEFPLRYSSVPTFM